MNDDGASDHDHGEVTDAWNEHQYQQGSTGRLNHVNVAPPVFRPVRPSKPQGMSEEKYERLMREKRCLMCEQVGHRRRDCPKIQASASGGATGGAWAANSPLKTTKKRGCPQTVPGNSCLCLEGVLRGWIQLLSQGHQGHHPGEKEEQ